MAGHSKWANIQHRKGRQDKARSKLFSKLSAFAYRDHGGLLAGEAVRDEAVAAQHTDRADAQQGAPGWG